MEDKVNLSDDNDDINYNDNALHQRTLQSDVKREWDHLLENNYDESELYRQPRKQKEAGVYMYI